MFLERSKIFASDNKYYVEGGKFNVYTGSTRLPNCTAYCKLRQAESCELSSPKSMFKGRSATGFPEAKNWYNDTTFDKGSKIKNGAIAVFDGASGHVAFVERVIDSTHAIISESNYDSDKTLRNWKYWRTREVELVVGKATLSGVGKLIGYIYLPINDKRTSRDTRVDQVEIKETLVNVRTAPSKSVIAQGLYCPMGIYNVLEWKTYNGYTWARLDTNCWVACGSWSTIYKAGSSKTELKARLKTLEAKQTELEAELKDVKAEIKAIKAQL